MKKVKASKGRPKKKPSSVKQMQNKYKAKVTPYDYNETSEWVNPEEELELSDLGFTLPEQMPTQVLSIRLPTELLNEIKALGSQKDVPYQALIKLFLDESIRRAKKKSA